MNNPRAVPMNDEIRRAKIMSKLLAKRQVGDCQAVRLVCTDVKIRHSRASQPHVAQPRIPELESLVS